MKRANPITMTKIKAVFIITVFIYCVICIFSFSDVRAGWIYYQPMTPLDYQVNIGMGEFGYAPEEEPGFFLDMLGINIKKIPEFLHPDEKGHIHYDPQTSPQEIIDHLNATGGMAIMCHPYFMINMTEPYLRYHSYLGLEAFNFVCEDMCDKK